MKLLVATCPLRFHLCCVLCLQVHQLLRPLPICFSKCSSSRLLQSRLLLGDCGIGSVESLLALGCLLQERFELVRGALHDRPTGA